MSQPFRSFGARTLGTPKNWSEAEVVTVARQLLAEHAQSREEATKAANLVCGNCEGSGNAPSTLMPGEFVTCFACEGTGKPNEKMLALPALSPQDNERIWKIGRLLKGKHGAAVLAVVKEHFPEMYRETETVPS